MTVVITVITLLHGLRKHFNYFTLTIYSPTWYPQEAPKTGHAQRHPIPPSPRSPPSQAVPHFPTEGPWSTHWAIFWRNGEPKETQQICLSLWLVAVSFVEFFPKFRVEEKEVDFFHLITAVIFGGLRRLRPCEVSGRRLSPGF